ncbi:hypothetical protein [Chengkuizengella marina]|nr:hypothetical protein [Chengkuizengella marina]
MFGKKTFLGFGVLAVLNIILGLAFWLGLIAGGIWLIKYFGII